MNYAVKLYGANARGIPPAWPELVTLLGAATSPIPDGWVLMTNVEFESHRAAHQAVYDQWRSDDAWRQTAVAAIKAEAQRRIFAITGYSAADPIPGIIRQINLSARSQYIMYRKLVLNIEPTADELTFLAGAAVAFERVLALRTFSDGLEARVVAGEVFDILSQAWPYGS